jgi:hypothetical protein
MAKKKDASLPKVIRDADHDISTILQQDMMKESELLKQLVDEVLQANMDIKDRNQERILKTREKLKQLDSEIDSLNENIDKIDRETVLEQLNQMIDAENIIYDNLKQIRLYEANHLSKRLSEYDDLYDGFFQQILSVKSTQDTYGVLFKDENKKLYEKQREITEEIISHFVSTHQTKLEDLHKRRDALAPLREGIKSIENDYYAFIESTRNDILSLKATSTSTYLKNNEEIKSVEELFEQKIKAVKELKSALKPDYIKKREDIIHLHEDKVAKIEIDLSEKNKEEIEREKIELEKKNEELQRIKRAIITAEKKRNHRKVQSLMKEYDHIERSKKSKFVNQAEKERSARLEETKAATIAKLKRLQIEHETALLDADYQLKLLDIEHEEDLMLHSIKHDRDALATDRTITETSLNHIKEMFIKRKEMLVEIFNKRLELRLEELDIMRSYELLEYTDTSFYGALLNDLQAVEEKRINTLLKHQPSYIKMKTVQDYFVKVKQKELDFYQKVHDIDRLILTKQNKSLADIEKQKEDINSEIIYQESLISIAKKENELQRIKVNALYENERNLAEEQANRIELGIKVNDTFVKSTLQNQLLFAEQQMACAESEYKIRLENIALTRDQEVAYARRKIDYFKQKYDYEISQLEKAMNDKLEDLNYKLLLFTDKKDSQRITEQIDKIKHHYQNQIDDINQQLEADEEILRFEKMINDPNRRAEEAKKDAEKLKDDTVLAFEQLYEQTNNKIKTMKQTNHSDASKGIVPLLNSDSVSNANTRLQKAIQEADELYQERIKKPQLRINELKATLLDITNDAMSKAFVQDLKTQKTALYESFNADKEALKKERDSAIKAIEEHAANQSKITFDKITLPAQYRSQKDIDSDYRMLVKREKAKTKQELKALKKSFKTQSKKHKKDLKKTLKTIDKTKKKFDKYIQYASSDLQKAKDDLKRQFELNKQRKETLITNNFLPNIEL